MLAADAGVAISAAGGAQNPSTAAQPPQSLPPPTAPPQPSALPRTLPLQHVDDVLMFKEEVVAAAEARGRLLLPAVAPMLNEDPATIASGVGVALRTLREATYAASLDNWGTWTPEARETRWALAGRADMNL